MSRVYEDPLTKSLYRQQRQFQTVKYVKNMHKWYANKTMVCMEIWDAIMAMASLIDMSDPDISLSNVHHLFQTAEMMRWAGEPEWMQVTGLIHDLGKIMYLQGNDRDGTSLTTQWGVVGDTFIVGCPLPKSCVYPQFNALNMDMYDEKYNEGTGMYSPHCGINNVLCSWGHDEYLYRVLKDNKVPLSDNKLAMAMVRFHSLYPWHQSNEYKDLMEEGDEELLKAVQHFQKYDLYSKLEEEMDIEELKEYYLPLLHKFIGNTLTF